MVHFGRLFGFRRADDRDKCNKTIFHFLFSAAKYCWVAADVARRAFGQYEEILPGDYCAAMSQRVENGKPEGFTALHILCNGSGVGLMAVEIVAALIDNKIVPLKAFSAWKNNDVSVFLPGVGLRQIVVGEVGRNINWQDWQC